MANERRRKENGNRNQNTSSGSDERIDGGLALARLRFEEDELNFRIGKQLEIIAAHERQLRDVHSQTREFKLPVGWLAAGIVSTVLSGLSTACCGITGFGFTAVLLVVIWLRFIAEIMHRKRQLDWDSGRESFTRKELDEAKEQLTVMREQLVLIKKRINDLERGVR